MGEHGPQRSILPPHLLKAIAERGDAAQKRGANKTSLISERIRRLRSIAAMKKRPAKIRVRG